MKRTTAILTAAILAVGTIQSSYAAAPGGDNDRSKLDERLDAARAVIEEVMSVPDKSIPQGILANASCVVVIPSMKKGAFLVGVQYGQGVATCRTPQGWSAPVFVKIEGASYGLQIGGQGTDLVLVAMNHDGLQKMLSDKFKLGADAAASAGPVGRNAQAGTDWKLNAEFLTWSRSKGLFAGLDLTGDVLSQNTDDTRIIYGADIPFKVILSGGQAVPPDAKPFVRAVAKYFVVSKSNQ